MDLEALLKVATEHGALGAVALAALALVALLIRSGAGGSKPKRSVEEILSSIDGRIGTIQERITDIDERVESLDRRLAKAESDLEHRPTRLEHHEIQLRLEKLSSSIALVQQTASATGHAVNRIEDYFLKTDNGPGK